MDPEGLTTSKLVFFHFSAKYEGKCVPMFAQIFRDGDTSLSGHVEQGRRAKASLWNDSLTKQLGIQTSSQVLTNPEGNLMILVQKGAGEWWIWIWTFPFFPIHLPLKLKNENEQPGRIFLQLSGDCVTKSDGSNLTFPSQKASVYWHKFIVSSLLRIY